VAQHLAAAAVALVLSAQRQVATMAALVELVQQTP
jgi:hypothetical protein